MEDKRTVSKHRGEAIAREYGIRFMETSAKANINIEKAFTELATAIYDKTSGKVRKYWQKTFLLFQKLSIYIPEIWVQIPD